MDVRAFLAEHPPFDALTPEELDRVVASVQIEHFAPGTVIVQQAGAPATHLFVVRRGGAEIVDGGRVIDEIGEGDVFGMWSLLDQVAPSATVRANEDTLCYLIDPEVANAVLRSGGGIAFVAASVRRQIAAVDESRRGEVDVARYREVGELVRRTPVTCDPETPVADAARLMASERISSLLVPNASDGSVGILTDRDLRTRVVAERRSGETPVRDVMTSQAETVPPDTMVGEVLLRMLEGGFHHFPIAAADGTVLGVVSDTDLMGVGRDTPFALKSSIERAPDRESVASAVGELPRVISTLVGSSADPVDVGHVIAFSIDAATRRLLELGMAEHGEPRVPWTWLALGSAARQEQAIRTDQDHAIAFEGDPDAADGSWAPLAEFVTSGLEAAGIPRCEGNVMATNDALRLSVQQWVGRFEYWMGLQTPKASEQLSIVFDFRKVAGPLDAAVTLDAVMATAPERPLFLQHLARRALDQRPPIGFVRGITIEQRGEHPGRVDIKHGGIMIIGNLARAYAIRAGITAKRTIDRLRAAEQAGGIDAETREGLEEAFRFLWEIRLLHHVQQLDSGGQPDDFVDPKELGGVARQGLKEAFRIIARAQKALAQQAGIALR